MSEIPKGDRPVPEPESSAAEAESPAPETETPTPEAESPAPETEAPSPEAESFTPETAAPPPQAEGPAPKPKRRFFRPSRIVLWILIAAAIVLLALEFRARSAFTNTCKAIDQAMDEAEQKGEGLYKTDLDRLLQGSPKRESTPGGEILTWRGVLKSRQIQVQYGAGGFIQNYTTTGDE